MSDDPVADLITKCAGGDRAAFRLLYRATAAKLMGVPAYPRGTGRGGGCLAGGLYPGLAARRALRPDPGARDDWLVAVSRNLAIDRLRARPSEMADEAMETVPDGAPRAETRLVAAGEARRIADCFSRWSPTGQRRCAAPIWTGCLCRPRRAPRGAAEHHALAAAQPAEAEGVSGPMTDASLTPRKTDEVLAAEYVLGVLDRDERTAVTARLRQDQGCRHGRRTGGAALRAERRICRSPRSRPPARIEARLFPVAVPPRRCPRCAGLLARGWPRRWCWPGWPRCRPGPTW